MNKTLNILLASVVFAFCCLASPLSAQSKLVPPKAVSDITGTYIGSWTSYGLDANGQVIKQAAWTDTMKAENPVVNQDRAYVTTIDEMTFEGGKIPPMKIPGKEGYLLNRDSTLGEYFIEAFGQTYKMQKLGENVFAYTVAAAPTELARLGVLNAQSAQHVMVKVITFEQGIETHNISRVTTVRWKDASGKQRTTQFVSLQGIHQRR